MTEQAIAPVPLTAEVAADPEELFKALGDRRPVHRVTLPDGMPSWLVTGYREAREALTDPRLLRSVDVAAPDLHRYHPLGGQAFPLSRHLVFADPPEHGRLRKLVQAAFTRRRTELLRPRVQQVTDELIDAFIDQGSADIVQDLALPVPIAMIWELLGVSMADRPDLEANTRVLTGINSASTYDDVVAAGGWFYQYFTRLVEERRAAPGDDVVSAMLSVQEHDDRLTDLEVQSCAFMLLSAGFETVANLIGTGVLTLLRNPDAMAVLKARPQLMPTAVEEILRFEGPVSNVTYHFAREPLSLGGVRIEAGDHVVVSVVGTNHDPVAFPAPDRFDLNREANPHLTFSHGVHFCLGAPLARLEGEVALGAVVRRLDNLRLTVPEESLQWRQSFVLHGLTSLPVAFDRP
jgi:cytochrome P450